ncbi:MAG: chemotaxis protein CheA [Actinobacteria bacterium HGW-Actinobacteria-10]|nr:MAG: chemotaxis protein CheA [Actinobacteria bacterium HGW-Actinobacteria-10]
MSEMDAYRDIFLSESGEFVQAITDGLIALETNPEDLEPVEVIFRGAHSLKGMSAAMGYDRTADLTHKMENLMSLVRKRERTVDSPLVDLMLEAVDMVKALINDEMAGSGATDPSELVGRLVAAAEPAPAGEPINGPTSEAALQSPAELQGSVAEDYLVSDGEALREGESLFRVVVTLEDACVLKAVRAYMVLKRMSHMGSVVETVPSAREIEDERFEQEFTAVVRTLADAEEVRKATMGVTEVLKAEVVRIEAAEPQKPQVEQMPTGAPAIEGARKRTQIPKLSETQTVRIAIGHLDKIVDLVGELVILRSQLDQLGMSLGSKDLSDAVEHLHSVAAELQHEVMHARMVPVGNIFNRFPRMVRDLARDLEKEVDFSMDGLDIELDRTVLDEIGDPIVHLLRNAIDHGIEPSDARVAMGKPPRAMVRLAATRDRDLVRITVTDDGRGIDCERVWAKAVESGLVEDSARDSYREDEILLFTCVAGFSTAAQATRVSGRGVGMDVVKGKIEHLGGSVNIYSIPGMGTEILLTLPLTLAIIQALLVSTYGQTFAVPLSSVDEVMNPEDVVVDTVDDSPVLIMRDGKVLPLFRLDALLNLGGDPRSVPVAGEHIILIADNAGQQRGLVVGEMMGRAEIVVKPLSGVFRGIRSFGGATVLGDGKIAFILDPRAVFSGREDSE